MPTVTRWYLDRLENGTAVLVHEDGRIAYLPASALPEGSRAGDWLQLVVTPLPQPPTTSH